MVLTWAGTKVEHLDYLLAELRGRRKAEKKDDKKD
jgi:hypothetical protein